MDFQYKYSPEAKTDLLGAIAYYIEEIEEPQISERLIKLMMKKVNLICENPYLYPKHHNEKLASLEIRFATVWDYLILYVPDDDTKTINILRIVHGKRDLTSIIE
ncbi:MAG: type II toxin-antitoxin system RelE/ParE family toxin [Oscillospiraceae bacterium]|nr:type II toxin-antitoxin system RelE/ParE family toxin [Oscillospiraceae bacterium]